MPYIRYPDSYVLIIERGNSKYGFLIIINRKIDQVGYLESDNLNDAIRELKNFIKKDQKYKFLRIFRNFNRKMQRFFGEFFV